MTQFFRSALVVLALAAISTPAFAQQGVLKNASIAATGAAAAVSVPLTGIEGVSVTVVNAGTYQLEFEGWTGQTWEAYPGIQLSDFSRDTSTTGAGTWFFGNLGFATIRVRASAYTSGAPNITIVRGFGHINAPYSAGSISGGNDAASATGAAVPSSGSYTGINVGGTLRGWTGISLGSHFAGTMAVVDGSGNQITSFGGGVQYTEGDTDASIAGTALMFEGAANGLVAATGDATNGLDVDITRSALPTGAATAAHQVTEHGYVDGIETLIGTTNTNTDAAALGIGATGDAAVTAGSTGSINAKLRLLTNQVSGLLTTAQFQTAFGSGSVVSADPCDGGTKVFVSGSQTASAQLFAGTASNRSYFCSIIIRQNMASTQTFALISGTGSVCATSTGPVTGGTTAAEGNDTSFSLGSGSGSVAKTDTDADNVCLVQSTTDRISFVISYVVAP